MNKELLQKAIEHIAQDDVGLGTALLAYDDGKPCCALGHMAVVAGIPLQKHLLDEDNTYAAIGDAYGLNLDEVWEANDSTPGPDRKKAVLDLLKGWLETDPA